jgi:hypothetical protein
MASKKPKLLYLHGDGYLTLEKNDRPMWGCPNNCMFLGVVPPSVVRIATKTGDPPPKCPGCGTDCRRLHLSENLEAEPMKE